MLSDRCKTIVSLEMKKLGLNCGLVHLGEVETASRLTSDQRDMLKIALMKSGLVLMDDSVARLMEKVKAILKEMVRNAAERQKENFSDYLSEKTGLNYANLSNLFSDVTGMTIEHYIITYKIELIKEFLLYEDLSLTEISYKLNYSSAAHLSGQFKKLTGLTPIYFKKLKRIRANELYIV